MGGLVVKNQGIELAKKMSESFQQGKSDGLLGMAFVSAPSSNGLRLIAY